MSGSNKPLLDLINFLSIEAVRNIVTFCKIASYMKHNSIEQVQSLTNNFTETFGNIVKYKGRHEAHKWLWYDLKCAQESLFLSTSFVQAVTSHHREQICTSTSCQQAARICSQSILRTWGFGGTSVAGTELSATSASCSLVYHMLWSHMPAPEVSFFFSCSSAITRPLTVPLIHIENPSRFLPTPPHSSDFCQLSLPSHLPFVVEFIRLSSGPYSKKSKLYCCCLATNYKHSYFLDNIRFSPVHITSLAGNNSSKKITIC